ncbi:hypothetical protein A3B45_00790 [Candidatus Daviesbacteria bacterium RIFCSPLOWO2_01_FULL_39_12]|uniref:Uncharacterized protein n=1 Tax=Candidatus Daviesbacteria bacterium RIFCSPLOWO2_01_FULL_39_12 TaxID=1797785 RepID=A0A1F5KQX6_9BACT|nr:MAG: hypothetical protein A3D79_01900 [Candidatus Daviesbacteria bacterium RIFCSPHIGHO2_02_FULL_39_8]OGE43244.1 MAG: hypothetical protein A3B45_00790 [Candidatus Daviesbacteria bacterium RIFCSPLOWO2_01_FULL_39_12]
MGTLITHINPHLDDVFAIWLLKKYDSKYAEYEVDFISATHDKGGEETEERVFVGTGGGKFDEHKEGLKTCAGSLVFDYLKNEGLLPKDELAVKALEEMVEWNKKIDMGTIPIEAYDEFSVPAFIRSRDNKKESSLKDVQLGSEILDRILRVLKKKQQSSVDWQERVEFQTRFGKTVAVKSNTIDRPFCKRAGGDLFILLSPKYHGVQFFTPSQSLDLSPIYEKVKKMDPEADWFLHQSHHMVLCGSSAAPDAKPTRLSFDELVEVVKNL